MPSRRPWSPLAWFFAVVVLIVVVLLGAGALTGPEEALWAFAALLAGLGTVFLAVSRWRR
ncbi:hypothetical protein GCM10010399_68880 [Dactylosporangium fulvum]|uniref:Uncharacterized protein n=1 Tax=Dactylosporangium fulvum TaxID=53359 RepID=A0ABY5VP06_9ACTN|nr:hypothetical protein [Dactylosporangium fulvum]UWP79462.1 hypothetical protein Dfulv_30380 [Dactylosporangium fulvum]